MIPLAPKQVRQLRLRAQCLHPRVPRERLLDAVRAVVGIQAQSRPAMELALRARVEGLTPGDVLAAINRQRSLARTWTMRGTLHLSTAEDTRWLVALLGPRFIPGGHKRRLELGLYDEKTAHGLGEIRAVLGEHHALTRSELVEALSARGIDLDRKSQAPIHLIGLAALEGLVCYGAYREDGEETFVLFDEWAGPKEPLPTAAALAGLARRYVRGYGPASLKDFAGWSGLGPADARTGWDSISGDQEFAGARIGNLAVLVTASELERPVDQVPIVRLLPAFDTYILGYSNRDLLVRPQVRSEVYHGGQTVPVVLVDGAAAGVWRYERKSKKLAITARAFESFTRQIQQLIAAEADDIGRFWAMSVSLTIEP